MSEETLYPKIPTYLARRALKFLPSNFGENEFPANLDLEKLMYKAAVFSVANLLLHFTADTAGENLLWGSTTGLAIRQVESHLLSNGWTFGTGEEERTVRFTKEHISDALKWLRDYRYITSEVYGFSLASRYAPTPRLVREFARALNLPE